MVVNGHVVPGALFDCRVHRFHHGKHLFENGTGPGPVLYLSKLEGYTEAALWRKIFEYTEKKLQLAQGSIEMTVLIENLFAAFKIDEILFELCHHSSDSNCDRQQYVLMKSDFLRVYMDLLIFTCKRRHAPAMTDMPVAEVFTAARENTNTYTAVRDEELLNKKLLELPRGCVRLRSVEMNVRYISVYTSLIVRFNRRGTVVVKGCVEDSATAEISRAQLWQRVYHRVSIAGTSKQVNAFLIKEMLGKVLYEEKLKQIMQALEHWHFP
ncbi:unnamed protein product [Peronospora destructor]|uniref:malate synthase n=1 Tax=Peronospora destructor TaxID=86335 RepID=A0AAV0V6W3_9STRA|nr:unnamed protein product [Peronospora destructor]